MEGITYVQLSEMEEKYARFQRVHIKKYVHRYITKLITT